jgi:hypothetical protein
MLGFAPRIRNVASTDRHKAARALGYPLIAAAGVGVVGFLAGFFLPLLLSPEANQGPLLGIFITGPGGAALGLAVGVVATLLRLNRSRFLMATGTVAAAVAIGTLLLSFPEPLQLGSVMEADVVRCETAGQRVPAAVAEWKHQIAAGWVRTPRDGWEADIPALLERDPGVVLILRVKRQVHLTEHRKPWNRGRVTQRVKPGDGGESAFYLRGAAPDCSEPLPAELRFSPEWNYTLPSPPDNGAGLLRLTAIGQVTPRLERAIASAE